MMNLKLSLVGLICFFTLIANFLIGGSSKILNNFLIFGMIVGVINYFLLRRRNTLEESERILPSQEVLDGDHFHNDFTQVPSGDEKNMISTCSLNAGHERPNEKPLENPSKNR